MPKLKTPLSPLPEQEPDCSMAAGEPDKEVCVPVSQGLLHPARGYGSLRGPQQPRDMREGWDVFSGRAVTAVTSTGTWPEP